ncbi:transporter substrate-binding domain-containing protein [Kaustia mangrovi]|uniref:Transporter substrate-binding domain-containing protein n=1 Tax=Kaustia mangrovi TaxID=2593653 RepID=A0A7S8HCT0_9HYPH|nr:transporter substrate-binding domain-containing protein [Kaustia mangrovi]QPC44052.1 transporter substrate-binding domain-containing protein [Kaustia mangrovi]
MVRIVSRGGLLAAIAGVLCTVGAQAAEMPPLPDQIEQQGVVQVGVKCDYPPDGYLDASGKPVGIEVEMARELAEYAFGSRDKVELTCVTSSNRVPSLVGSKVDLLIATMGVTPARAEVVDFTRPYAWSASSVLVPADSDIQSMKDLDGKTVGLVKGAWQISWFDENMPGVEQMRLDSVSDVLQAMMQGRAVAYAHDFPVQLGLATKNDRLRMLDDRYKIGTRAAAARKGETDWVAYVNAALDRMAETGRFEEWIRKYEDDPGLIEAKLKLWDVSQMPKAAE